MIKMIAVLLKYVFRMLSTASHLAKKTGIVLFVGSWDFEPVLTTDISLTAINFINERSLRGCASLGRSVWRLLRSRETHQRDGCLVKHLLHIINYIFAAPNAPYHATICSISTYFCLYICLSSSRFVRSDVCSVWDVLSLLVINYIFAGYPLPWTMHLVQ